VEEFERGVRLFGANVRFAILFVALKAKGRALSGLLKAYHLSTWAPPVPSRANSRYRL
jgi:hypothetical protein